jgi:hypothetical protein
MFHEDHPETFEDAWLRAEACYKLVPGAKVTFKPSPEFLEKPQPIDWEYVKQEVSKQGVLSITCPRSRASGNMTCGCTKLPLVNKP